MEHKYTQGHPSVFVINTTVMGKVRTQKQGWFSTKTVTEEVQSKVCQVCISVESHGRYFEPCIETIVVGQYIGHRGEREREKIRKEYIEWFKGAN